MPVKSKGVRKMHKSIAISLALLSLLVFGTQCRKKEAPVEVKPFKPTIPLGLNDDLMIPKNNPLTEDKIALGHMLYFEERISLDGTVSCATCHNPEKGWSDGSPVSTGIKGLKGTRNAPTIVNSTYMFSQFWDGRAATLEDQAVGPMMNMVEMGNPDHTLLVQRIKDIPGYQPLFKGLGEEEHR
jgi:cytochrome c peroxidase